MKKGGPKSAVWGFCKIFYYLGYMKVIPLDLYRNKVIDKYANQ
jgi:hypothetical protein